MHALGLPHEMAASVPLASPPGFGVGSVCHGPSGPRPAVLDNPVAGLTHWPWPKALGCHNRALCPDPAPESAWAGDADRAPIKLANTAAEASNRRPRRPLRPNPDISEKLL